MRSVQIITSPVLRQFATIVGEGELAVTTKLGSSTVSRVKFKRMDFPSNPGEQVKFIQGRIANEYPTAETMLAGMFMRCIEDQIGAVNQLIAQ